MWSEERRRDAERYDDAGQNEEILDGMIESGDGEVGSKALGQGDVAQGRLGHV